MKPELVFLIGDFDDKDDLKQKIEDAIAYVNDKLKVNKNYRGTLEDLIALRGLLLGDFGKIALYINSDFIDIFKERLIKGE